MRYHDFKRGDKEVHYWESVLPGDLVHSPGSHAFKANDFAKFCHGSAYERDEVDILTLADGLLLVISRFDGCPGVSEWDDMITFMVMSRHGPLILMQTKKAQ